MRRSTFIMKAKPVPAIVMLGPGAGVTQFGRLIVVAEAKATTETQRTQNREHRRVLCDLCAFVVTGFSN